MYKVEMKRFQLTAKYGYDVICNFFCDFARGKSKIPPESCYSETEELETRVHCRIAEDALANYYGIKIID